MIRTLNVVLVITSIVALPLKRFLQRNIETKLSRVLISGQVHEGSAISFAVQNDELEPVQYMSLAKH